MFEIIFQCVIFGAFINFWIIDTNGAEFLIRLIEIITIMRCFRMIRLLYEIHHWKTIILTIKSFFKPFSSLLLVTFILFLFFAIIGDRIFGGLAYNEPAVIYNPNIPNSYIDMNFNDLVNSFITLFSLMAGNNWLVIEEVFIKRNGKFLTRLFLLSFWFFSVMVILNILISQL